MSEQAKNPLEIYREKVLSGEVVPTPRKTVEERFAERPTMKNAVYLKCKECLGSEPSWKTDCKNCASVNCPLYQFRPYK